MTPTDAVEELENLITSRSRIRQIINQYEDALRASVSISASPTDSIHVTGGHTGGSKIESHVIRAEMLYSQYLAAVDTYLEDERSISGTIDLIDDWRLRGLLHYRYVCGYTYGRTGDVMEVSSKQLRRYYWPAIDAYCMLRSGSQTAGN